jgi:hypothetical protein
MTSHGKARPLFTLASIGALAVGIAACNSGSSGSQYGYDPGNSGYSSVGSNPNESGALNWENQAQENANSAISDMGPGGAADPADESNSVSYSGGGGDDSGD